MLKRRPGLIGAAVLAAFLVFAVACGGDDEEEATTGAATTTTTQSTEAAAQTTTTTTTPSTTAAASTSSTTTTTSSTTTAQPTPATTTADTPAKPETVMTAKGNAVITVEGEPVYGNMIRRFGFGDWAVFDPQHADMRTSMMGMVAMQPIYETLLSFDEPFDPAKGSIIVPNLAKAFEFSSDNLKLTVKLREGITWHDGMPFTSADVQATFDRILDPSIKKAPNAEASVPIIESVSSPDAETVIFDMGDQPSNLILPYLATTWISIVPKHIFDQKGPDGLLEAPVGTGPFLIDWADKQRGIGYKKNPEYWATDQEGRALPYLDQMELNTVKDSTQQLALIRGGQVDVWPMWPAMEISTANAIKSQLGDQIYIDQLQLDAIVQMFLNTSAPPFDNPQVRLAAMHALDRHEWVNRIFGTPYEGGGYPGYALDPVLYRGFGLSPEEMLQYPGLNPANRSEDLARAKQLLADAGYPDGVDLPNGVMTGQAANYDQMAQVAASLLREAGFNTEAQVMEWGAFFAGLGEGEFQIARNAWAGVVPDPLGMLSLTFGSWGATNNWTQWNNSEFDGLWERASRTVDVTEKQELVKQMQRKILGEDTSVINLVMATSNAPRWSYVHNYYPGPTPYGEHGFRHVWIDR